MRGFGAFIRHLMTPLNFPEYAMRTKSQGDKTFIFDVVRKKYVALTPEEWVRQHVIRYLVAEKGYPATLISVETPLKYARMDKRSDVLVNDRNGRPVMLVECKAPEVPVTQKVFEQIAVYNTVIRAACLMVTNGLQHYCLAAATETASPCFLKEIPDYKELLLMRKGD